MKDWIIHNIFEDTASRFPENIAVKAGSWEIPYSELNAYANRVAHALAEFGTSSQSIVAIYSAASIEYVVAMLGVLKSGAVFMPLLPRFPDERLTTVLNKTKPKIFITDRPLETELFARLQKPNLTSWPSEVIVFDDLYNFSVKAFPSEKPVATSRVFSKENPPSTTAPDDGCYIMTTSASTGEPKAILGCHKGLTHFIHWEITEFSLNQSVRVSLLSPLTFDVSLRDIFVPLIAGGTLCIPDVEARHNPRKLPTWMHDSGITLTHIVPTLFRLLTREIQDFSAGKEALPDLEFALIAGEPLYGNDIIKWRQANGNRAELVNVYGPSETTLAKLFYRIKDKELTPTEIVPIGKPIPDTEVLIIKNDKPCSVGESGEIHIKTAFMSKGYYNDPTLNEMSFIQNPLVTDREDIIYKSGDQGKFLPDGNVCFGGRLDGQIKLYGNRIETGEIEVGLRQHPQVREAAVAAKKDPFGNVRLIGYMVPEQGQKITVESLRRFLGDKLPDYMVPAVIVTLKALPLTHNEKINRSALPEPDGTRPEMEQPYVAPSTTLEKALTEIWRQVLGLDQVGIHDNFFDLGGTSILAVKAISLVHGSLGIELPIVKLFQYPNISVLSKYLSQSQRDQPSYEKAQDRAQHRRAAFSRQKRSI